jgi:hypothetical protein
MYTYTQAPWSLRMLEVLAEGRPDALQASAVAHAWTIQRCQTLRWHGPAPSQT